MIRAREVQSHGRGESLHGDVAPGMVLSGGEAVVVAEAGK